MAADQATASYSGAWGKPAAVVVWSVILTALGFACHLWDVGALPGKGYTNGTFALLLLNVIAALAVCTWLHKVSALARIPLILLALGAYLKYPATASDSTWYLISLNLSHSLFPRLAVALVTVSIWSRASTVIRWVLATVLLALWEPLVWLVLKDFALKPRLQCNWATAEDVFLLVAILAPVSWCARSVTNHSTDTLRRQFRHMITGFVGLASCIALIVAGNKVPMPKGSSSLESRIVFPSAMRYDELKDPSEVARLLSEAQENYKAAEYTGDGTVAAQWLLRRNALVERLRTLRGGG